MPNEVNTREKYTRTVLHSVHCHYDSDFTVELFWDVTEFRVEYQILGLEGVHSASGVKLRSDFCPENREYGHRDPSR
jgi:hypothetical protein